MNIAEMLKGVLGQTYGGPSIGFEDGCFVLYVWSDAPVGMDIMCRHEDWDQFLRLCSEYSDYVPGDETIPAHELVIGDPG